MRVRIGPVAAALLCVAVILAAGCGSKKKSTATPTVAAHAAVASPTPALTAQELLDAGKATLQHDKSFHFVLTHENGSTPIANGINMTRAEGDFLAPDKFKATVDGTIQRNLAISVKVINVGSQVWLNLAGNKYTPLQNGVGAAAILDPNTGVVNAIGNVKSPVIAGTDTISGQPATIVAGTIDAGQLTALDQGAQAGKQVNGKVWIGTNDHQVYRIRLEGPLSDGEPANIARQIELSQFNEPLDIQPPTT